MGYDLASKLSLLTKMQLDIGFVWSIGRLCEKDIPVDGSVKVQRSKAGKFDNEVVQPRESYDMIVETKIGHVRRMIEEVQDPLGFQTVWFEIASGETEESDVMLNDAVGEQRTNVIKRKNLTFDDEFLIGKLDLKGCSSAGWDSKHE